MNHYIIKEHTMGMLVRKQIHSCVSCGKEIKLGDEITTTRTSNHLRPRCLECSKRLCII